jgi:hypothetical protein
MFRYLARPISEMHSEKSVSGREMHRSRTQPLRAGLRMVHGETHGADECPATHAVRKGVWPDDGLEHFLSLNDVSIREIRPFHRSHSASPYHLFLCRDRPKPDRVSRNRRSQSDPLRCLWTWPFAKPWCQAILGRQLLEVYVRFSRSAAEAGVGDVAVNVLVDGAERGLVLNRDRVAGQSRRVVEACWLGRGVVAAGRRKCMRS